MSPKLPPVTKLPNVPISERKSLPECMCVYFALDGDNVILYIGRTLDLRYRFRSHGKLTELIQNGCEKIAWLEIKDKRTLERTERNLIFEFKPLLNMTWHSRAYLAASHEIKRKIIEVTTTLGITVDEFLGQAVESATARLDTQKGFTWPC